MEAKRKPEIFLEVSCGSFKIATEEISCNVKILNSLGASTTEESTQETQQKLSVVNAPQQQALPVEDPFMSRLCNL